MTAARLVARTVRGLEGMLVTEILSGGLGEVLEVGHREVRFSGRAGRGLLGLRTADDLFVLAAESHGVGGGRAHLARLQAAVGSADLARALRVRERCGGQAVAPVVDVSASFLGRRAYTRYDLEDAVGAVLAGRLGAAYHSRRGGERAPAGGLSWRVTVVDDRATVALRVAERPLHRRPYKVASVAGTLHPPVAAAMVALAAPGPGLTVLDPCCGAGTIPIEAARAAPGARVLGLDADASAVAAAARNGRGARVAWGRADAGALPVAAGSIHRVLLNPPWERQVRARGSLAAHPDLLWREVRRVLAPDGLVVALLPDHDHGPGGAAGFAVRRELPLSLFGAHPVLVVLRPA